MIRKGEIFFTSARKFNDPFDCTIPPRYDLLDKESFLEIVKRNIREDYPKLSPKEFNNLVQEIKSHKNYMQNDSITFANKQLQEAKYNNFGIFTLSAEKENILMWAHYSNYHEGFCIGLNKTKFEIYLAKLYKEKQIPIFPIRVEYETEYPVLDPRNMDDNDWGIKQFSIKSSEWKYEKEWRYILTGFTDFRTTIDYDIFEELIFGCKIPSPDKDEIIGIIQKWPSKLKVFQAIKKYYEFGLKFEKVEY